MERLRSPPRIRGHVHCSAGGVLSPSIFFACPRDLTLGWFDNSGCAIKEGALKTYSKIFETVPVPFNFGPERGKPPHRELRHLLLFFNSLIITSKCCETGPTVYRPYPRRLQSLPVCRCNCEGGGFSPIA